MAPGQGGVTRQDQPCNTGCQAGRGWGRPGAGLAAAPGCQTCCVTLGQLPTLSGPVFFPLDDGSASSWGLPRTSSAHRRWRGRRIPSGIMFRSEVESPTPIHKRGGEPPHQAFGDCHWHIVGPRPRLAEWTRVEPFATVTTPRETEVLFWPKVTQLGGGQTRMCSWAAVAHSRCQRSPKEFSFVLSLGGCGSL